MLGGLLILAAFLMILIGIPITFSLGTASLVGLMAEGAPLFVAIQRMFTATDSFPLVAIPLFILAGELMSAGGISRRLIKLADVLVGHWPGGLGFVVIVATTFFAAVSGAAIAAAAVIGGMLIPQLVEKGYSRPFSAVLVASAATMDPLIPPSIPLVIYGVITSTSIAKLFIGGFIPGLLMAVALLIPVYVISKKRGYKGREKRATLSEVWEAFKESFFPMLAPVIIIGGILLGWFTPTESAAVAVAYTFILGLLMRELDLRTIPRILRNTAVSTGVVLIVLGTASTFTWFLTVQRVPQAAAEFLTSISDSPIVILLLMNVILLVVGTFIDTISALTIFTPLFYPIGLAYGIDPIHMGQIIVLNLSIGMITPPLGVCLFVAANIAKTTLTKMLSELWPMLACLLISLLLVTFIPQLSTFLPSLMK